MTYIERVVRAWKWLRVPFHYYKIRQLVSPIYNLLASAPQASTGLPKYSSMFWEREVEAQLFFIHQFLSSYLVSFLLHIFLYIYFIILFLEYFRYIFLVTLIVSGHFTGYNCHVAKWNQIIRDN
jgi:hypothetical protein